MATLPRSGTIFRRRSSAVRTPLRCDGGINTGTGQAICYTGSLVTLGYNFKHKAGMASGIALCGCGLCTFVFPPVSQFFVDSYGLHGAFLLLGALGFQSTVCGALMRPTEFENVTKRKLYCGGKSSEHDEKVSLEQELHCFTRLCLMLKSLQFCLFLASSVAFNMGQSIIYLFLPDYFRHLGSSSMEAAFILSIAGVTGVVARVLIGFLTQQVNSAIVYGGTFGIMGIITFFVKYMTTLPSKLFFTSLFGLYTGACWVLHYTILLETVGVGKLSDAMGIGMIFCGVGYFTGPPLAEMVVIEYDEFYLAFVFAGSSFLLAAFTGLLVKTLPNTLNTDLKIDNLETDIGEMSDVLLESKVVAESCEVERRIPLIFDIES